MELLIVSFGYKYGLPPEAGLTLDVRFLPNPFHDPGLRPLSGLDAPVRDYVCKLPQAKGLLCKLDDLAAYLPALYREDGRKNLTIAVGCTGGRHRSVAVACALHGLLTARGYDFTLFHRDIERDAKAAHGR